MGTLTANVPRLAEHCPHKLATSCRLTATPRCCACADRRAHTSTYSIYIDGIGFVRRGTRWQSYCWFCREFWNNRVRACGLEAGQTRIPDEPDQSAFLERWFEFHQGFRVVAGEGRKQEKVAVLGEPLRDVAPGELPKTLEELRQGRRRSETEASREVSRRNPASASVEASRSQANVSVEEFLDDLLNELSDDDDTAHSSSNRRRRSSANNRDGVRAIVPILQAFENGRGVNVGASGSTRPLRQQQAAERFTRIFGTREDVESEDYQSPIGGLFTRADDRYQQAERERQENTSSVDSYLMRTAERIWAADWATINEGSQRPDVIDTRTLDGDDRPPAKSDEELHVKLACKICYTQLANTAVLPCGHMSMCEYCADIQIPVKEHHRTIPKSKSNCPVCRKKVTSRVRIHI